MSSRQEIVKAFLWIDANSEKLKNRIDSGDASAKMLADNFNLATSNPESSLAWTLFQFSFTSLQQQNDSEWNEPSPDKRKAAEEILEKILRK